MTWTKGILSLSVAIFVNFYKLIIGIVIYSCFHIGSGQSSLNYIFSSSVSKSLLPPSSSSSDKFSSACISLSAATSSSPAAASSVCTLLNQTPSPEVTDISRSSPMEALTVDRGVAAELKQSRKSLESPVSLGSLDKKSRMERVNSSVLKVDFESERNIVSDQKDQVPINMSCCICQVDFGNIWIILNDHIIMI